MSTPEDLCREMKTAIESSLESATAEVRAASPGHFEIRVISPVFEGKPRVKQQQLVYGAIGPFLAGPDAPVHAIDRLETVSSV